MKNLFDLEKYIIDPVKIDRKGMRKIFADVKWLYKFLKKEGVDAYNSLLLSNKIVSNGFITYVVINLRK